MPKLHCLYNASIYKHKIKLAIGPSHTIMGMLRFRIWVLGILSCALLSFLNQFYWYRKELLSITAILAQIAVVPLGWFMASKIVTRVFFRRTSWELCLNSYPFNVKEHMLIAIFVKSRARTEYAIYIVMVIKVFSKGTWWNQWRWGGHGISFRFHCSANLSLLQL